MKRFFQSPTPLAFFGFLLTFLLTVAWRMPLGTSSTTFLSLAHAAPPPPAVTPAEIPPPPPAPIPQPIAPTAPPAYAFALPVPAGATPVVAPVPTMLPAVAQAIAPVEPVEAAHDANARKKIRHASAHKPRAVAAPAEESTANLLAAGAEGKPAKKHK